MQNDFLYCIVCGLVAEVTHVAKYVVKDNQFTSHVPMETLPSH